MPGTELEKNWLARNFIEYEPEETMTTPPAVPGVLEYVLKLTWPDGLEPEASPISPAPKASKKLPKCDYLVVTWTRAEAQALADVLTVGESFPKKWYPYDRFFASKYKDRIRPRAPSQRVNRLGEYFPAKIGKKKILCFKSELHLNQDGIKTGDGTATLPVKDLWKQLITETKPKLVITVGTAGATFRDHLLGDVMITRGAKFRLNDEFKNEPFNDAAYKSNLPEVPTSYFGACQALLRTHQNRLQQNPWGPPIAGVGGTLDLPFRTPRFFVDGKDFDAYLPILTTDYFEFGTSANHLDAEGCGVEMGDAVLGMVAKEMGSGAPPWLVIRNASDPQINGAVANWLQKEYAVLYYQKFGYWTSVSSAIATWAVIAGH